MRILVIEDDEDLSDALVRRLRRLGHAVDSQNDGLSADGVLQYETFDLVILDIGLPRMSGFDILHRLRDRGSKTPVLALTARIDIEDRVHALDTGADDYLAKPFGVSELLARLRVLLRRHGRGGAGNAAEIAFGDVRVDFSRRVVERAGQHVHLTAMEYRLLAVLLAHRGKVMTHRELLRQVWGPSHVESNHYLRIYMGHLRQKLEAEPAQPVFLLTEIGVGYRFAG